MQKRLLPLICLAAACNSNPSNPEAMKGADLEATVTSAEDVNSPHHDVGSTAHTADAIIPDVHEVTLGFPGGALDAPKAVILYEIGVSNPSVDPVIFTTTMLNDARRVELPVGEFQRFVSRASTVDWSGNWGWKGGWLAKLVCQDDTERLFTVSYIPGYLRLIGPKLPYYQIASKSRPDWDLFLNKAIDVMLADGLLFSPVLKPQCAVLYDIDVRKPWSNSVPTNRELEKVSHVELRTDELSRLMKLTGRVERQSSVHWEGGLLVELSYDNGSRCFVTVSQDNGYLRGLGRAPYYEIDPRAAEEWKSFIKSAAEVMHVGGR